jgi:AraC family transcriptional regulator
VAQSAYLLETRRLTIGEFRCPPDDPAWRETNYIGDEPHLVFPLTPVVIDQLDKDSVLTTSNHSIFYDAGQLYRRRLESEQGDHCFFIRLERGMLERIVGDRPVEIDAPTDRRTYLRRHLLVQQLRTGSISTSRAEETAFELVRSALTRTASVPRASRDRTRAVHHELAEAAKAVIARSFTEPLSLGRLAGRLRTSPFHLARVFRAETGFSIDGYQRSLRLRAALERLPAYRDGLTTLALELGFSSHSHFTEMFRREFGVAPSALP